MKSYPQASFAGVYVPGGGPLALVSSEVRTCALPYFFSRTAGREAGRYGAGKNGGKVEGIPQYKIDRELSPTSPLLVPPLSPTGFFMVSPLKTHFVPCVPYSFGEIAGLEIFHTFCLLKTYAKKPPGNWCGAVLGGVLGLDGRYAALVGS